MRDDEASLVAPAFVVLGDSYAMGWGVAQPATFPERLQARLGVPGLNAGVSSYGTARELALLRRLDRRALRALVVQYCWNDNAENRHWVAHGGRLETRPEAEYRRIAAEHAAALRYYPGKHLVTLLRVLRDRWAPMRAGSAGSSPAEAAATATSPIDSVAAAVEDFLAVLDGHADLLGGRPVVVLVACERTMRVAEAVRTALASGRSPRLAPLARRGLNDSDPQPR